MVFFYVRVSDKNQNVQRQLEALNQFYPNIIEENIYIDKESGKDFEREAFLKLKMVVKRGDIICVKSLDHFGRNKEMIKEELGEFQEKGVRLKILDIPTTLVEVGKIKNG